MTMSLIQYLILWCKTSENSGKETMNQNNLFFITFFFKFKSEKEIKLDNNKIALWILVFFPNL